MKKRLFWIILILFVPFWLGCENAFEPLEKNDRYVFSMYGMLDLHADTQWVRVMPIGETLIASSPEPNGTQVYLTHSSTGETTVLDDSLFRFGADAYVWNYSTDQTLQPNEEYLVMAASPDGGQSISTVTLPSVLPVPEVSYSENSEQGLVTGSSEEPLVVVETRYRVQAITDMGCAPETELVFSHLADVVHLEDGEYRLSIENRGAISRELGVTAGSFNVNSRELFIATGSKDWPDLSGLSEEEIILPDVISNVEGGTGLVAGVAGRRVEITPRREPC